MGQPICFKATTMGCPHFFTPSFYPLCAGSWAKWMVHPGLRVPPSRGAPIMRTARRPGFREPQTGAIMSTSASPREGVLTQRRIKSKQNGGSATSGQTVVSSPRHDGHESGTALPGVRGTPSQRMMLNGPDKGKKHRMISSLARCLLHAQAPCRGAAGRSGLSPVCRQR